VATAATLNTSLPQKKK
jgi:hypothetical protein